MKKKIIIFLFIVCVIIIALSLIILNSKHENKETNPLPVDYDEKIEQNDNIDEENEKVNSIVQEHGFNVNENIYELAKEYDGRETVIVKTSIQYKVALAGAIKGSIPEFTEIDDLLKKAPTHTGIWITEKSRSEFLDILKTITNGDYEINQDGFLITNSSVNNKYGKIIEKMTSDGRLYVFDIDSITYLVDEVTGKIQNYPFEEMDPHQGYEYFESDNKYMFIISKNKLGKTSKIDALKEILKNK